MRRRIDTAVPSGSVLLDNLTLQSAFRALSTPPDGLPPIDTPSRHRHLGNKWNYDLSRDFRVSIDIACLAQLLQARVLTDHRVADPEFLHQWAPRVSYAPAPRPT